MHISNHYSAYTASWLALSLVILTPAWNPNTTHPKFADDIFMLKCRWTI